MTLNSGSFAIELAKGLSTVAPVKSVEAPNIDKADSNLALFDQLIPDGPISNASRKLYADGHYRQAVVDGFICLDGLVRCKSKTAASGSGLMRTVFSPNNPTLRLNGLAHQSEKDEQQGYMELFAGAIMAIRNPRAHDHKWHDTVDTALQLLHFAHHLALKVDQAKVCRRRNSKKV